MTFASRLALAALAAFAALLPGSSAAGPVTLGGRFNGLHTQVTDRLGVLPAEGGTSAEAKERAALTSALALLDTESNAIGTDLPLAAKIAAFLKKGNQGIYFGFEMNLMVINLRDDVGAILEDVPYYPVAIPINIGAKFQRQSEVAQFFLGSGTLANDPAKAFKFFQKALKTLAKRQSIVDRQLAPMKATRLQCNFFTQSDTEETPFYDSKKGQAEVSVVYDQSDDLAILTVLCDPDGEQREVVIHLPSPTVGEVYTSQGPVAPGSLTVGGVPCTTEDPEVVYISSIDSWILGSFDPEAGVISGAFNFSWAQTVVGGGDTTNCGSGYGLFTVRDFTVVP